MLKYTTLWEILVKRFYAEYFTDMATHTAKAIAINLGATENDLSQTIDYNHPEVKELAEKLKGYEQEFIILDLLMSARTLKRLIEVLTNQKSTYSDFTELTKQLENRLTDELRLRKFFCIERDKESFLLEKNLFGATVTTAFPSVTIDIEEAGKCLAFERWTASVFHLMRVMEVALLVLGSALKLLPTTNRSWDSVLKKYEAELSKPLAQRCPEWAADDSFFSGATVFLRSVKDAWRNPTMHVEKVYTEEQAEDVWNAVKGFMRHLATKLKE